MYYFFVEIFFVCLLAITICLKNKNKKFVSDFVLAVNKLENRELNKQNTRKYLF